MFRLAQGAHGDAFHRGNIPYSRSLPKLENWILKRFHPNVLIQGKTADIENVLAALTPDFHGVQCSWPTVPAAIPTPVTVIVREVTRISPESLQALNSLMDERQSRLQVVSTSSEPIYPAVEQGTFPEVLFYRLNVITIGRT
jgi:hypothetical protein